MRNFIAKAPTDVIDLIYRALKQYHDESIKFVSLDGDNDSNEIILTVDDGDEKVDWVISSNDIREADEG
jgi:hypothetical protein